MYASYLVNAAIGEYLIGAVGNNRKTSIKTKHLP